MNVYVLLCNPNVNEEDTEVEGVFSTVEKAEAAAFPPHPSLQWQTLPGVKCMKFINLPDDTYYEIQEHSVV